MICKTVGRSEQQKEEEKEMAEDYRNQAIGVFELESECICFVALDAAAKAAAGEKWSCGRSLREDERKCL